MYRQLPNNDGSAAIGSAVTQFTHSVISSTALLGPADNDIKLHDLFHSYHTRVRISELAMSSMVVSGLKLAAFAAAQNSSARLASESQGSSEPVIASRTQQGPILDALAQASVLGAFYRQATDWITHSTSGNVKFRDALCAIVKTTMLGHWRGTGLEVMQMSGFKIMFGHMPQIEVGYLCLNSGGIPLLNHAQAFMRQLMIYEGDRFKPSCGQSTCRLST